MKTYNYYIVIDNTVSTKQFIHYFETALKEFIAAKRREPFALEGMCLSLYLVNNDFTKVNDSSDLCNFKFESGIQYSKNSKLKLVPVIKEILSVLNPYNCNYLLICVDGQIEDSLEMELQIENIQQNFKRSIGLGIGPIADVSSLCHICDGVYQDKEFITRGNLREDIEVIDTFKWFLNSIIRDFSADLDGPMDIIVQPVLPYIKTIKPPIYT